MGGGGSKVSNADERSQGRGTQPGREMDTECLPVSTELLAGQGEQVGNSQEGRGQGQGLPHSNPTRGSSRGCPRPVPVPPSCFFPAGEAGPESEFKQLLPDPRKEAALAESSAVQLSEEHCASGTECRLTNAVCGCAVWASSTWLPSPKVLSSRTGTSMRTSYIFTGEESQRGKGCRLHPCSGSWELRIPNGRHHQE